MQTSTDTLAGTDTPSFVSSASDFLAGLTADYTQIKAVDYGNAGGVPPTAATQTATPSFRLTNGQIAIGVLVLLGLGFLVVRKKRG